MTARIAGQRFRQRKLSTKQSLAIVRENEVDTLGVDDEAQRHIPKVETGVEKAEETVSIVAYFPDSEELWLDVCRRVDPDAQDDTTAITCLFSSTATHHRLRLLLT